MINTVKVLSEKMAIVRRVAKQRVRVVQSMDPGGMRKKVSKGRMLDPRDPESIKTVQYMMSGIYRGVWFPIKQLITSVVDSVVTEADEGTQTREFMRFRGDSKSFRPGQEARTQGYGHKQFVCFAEPNHVVSKITASEGFDD